MSVIPPMPPVPKWDPMDPPEIKTWIAASEAEIDQFIAAIPAWADGYPPIKFGDRLPLQNADGKAVMVRRVVEAWRAVVHPKHQVYLHPEVYPPEITAGVRLEGLVEDVLMLTLDTLPMAPAVIIAHPKEKPSIPLMPAEMYGKPPMVHQVPPEETRVVISQGFCYIQVLGKWKVARELPPAGTDDRDLVDWADDFASMSNIEFRNHGIVMLTSEHDLIVEIAHQISRHRKS